MKQNAILIITALSLAILFTLYFTLANSDILNIIFNYLNACGLLLGIANVFIKKMPFLSRVIIIAIIGGLVFTTWTYFSAPNFWKTAITIGIIVGILTPIFSNLFIKKTD